MAAIKVHDKSFGPYLSEETIQHRVKELAEQINHDYAGKRPLFIAILNGSFMFASDLFKHLDIQAELCFIKLASYRGMKSSGYYYKKPGQHLWTYLYWENVLHLRTGSQ